MGSFEAMRIGGDEEEFLINIVGHFENAKMINSILTDLNPEIASRVIHVGKDPIGSALTLRERLADGEMVAILGDRTGINDKTVTVNFLGRPAEFPAGPFLLASILRAPVYLVFGLYFEPNRYELFCEPFVEQVKLPRGDRQAALQEIVQRYADRLEHYCRLAPDNWFNFYDFWKSAETPES
jgi:predicted LPLAT superfamily acyltransferase